jgi:hypothetical protein
MRNTNWNRFINIGAAALTLALTTTVTLAGLGNKGNPGVLPPQSTFGDRTYAQWAAAWGQWAYYFDLGANPVSDQNGELAGLGQSGHVWFLAGSFSVIEPAKPVKRTITVPPGKALFFPIINCIWVNLEGYGDNPWSDEQRALARTQISPFIDDAVNLSCRIDDVEVVNLADYRCKTADGDEYTVTLSTDNNSFGLPAGTYGPCVDDGIYLMLAPLSAGKHTIHFTANSLWLGQPASLDVTYIITVGK